jgi:hypothetical protein
MRLKPNRALLIKAVSVAGIAIASFVFTFSQLSLLKLVSQAVSADTGFESLEHQTAFDSRRLAIENATTQATPKNEKRRRKSLPIDADSIVANPGSSPRSSNRTRVSFKAQPHFSEQLVDEFIIGAKEEATRRKKLKMLKRIIEARRKKDKKRNKKPKRVVLQVPTPIFVPSLPKSGTTTVHEYFQCGGQKSAHLIGNRGNSTFKIGRCAHRNFRQGQAPFEGCGDYDVWTDTGA